MIQRLIIVGIVALQQTHSVTTGQCAEPARSVQALRKRPDVKITISKETTKVTAPLSKDGYVDYATALDRLAKKGVIPKDNSVIPLIIAFGKEHIGEETRDEYMGRIGLTTFPSQKRHFVELPQWHEDEELHKRLLFATHNLWGRAQYPRIAKWITSNKQPLRLVTQASRRSKFYSPIFISEFDTVFGKINPGLAGALEPLVTLHRQAVRALLARAMLRLDAGHPDDCWKDLFAAHRLTRLVGQHPTVIGAVWSLNSESEVCVAERTFLLRADLSPQQLRRVARDLDSLPPMPVVAEKYDRAGRWAYLDSVSRIATGGLKTLKLLSDLTQLPLKRVSDSGLTYVAHQQNAPEWPFADAALNYVDWNYILREGNRWYDRLVAALGKPAGPERMKAVNALADEHRRIRVLAHPDRFDSQVAMGLDLLGSVVAAFLPQPNTVGCAYLYRPHTRRYMTIQFNRVCLGLLVASFSQVMEYEDRTKTQFQLTQLTAALAIYREKHGVYPPNISKLTGMHIKSVSKDLYSGKQFGYRSTGRHFELFSVGKKAKRDLDDKSDELVVRSKQQN